MVTDKKSANSDIIKSVGWSSEFRKIWPNSVKFDSFLSVNPELRIYF